MTKFKCPYCNTEKGSNGYFKSWCSVVVHIRYCTKSNNEYIIHKELGPVHYSELLNESVAVLKNKYGITKLRDMQQKFKSLGLIKDNIYKKYSRRDVILCIQQKALELGRTPTNYDFRKTNGDYPSIGFIVAEFGSWKQALLDAGFYPEHSELYGKPTIAKDGHKYRSKAEADFVDKYLADKFTYDIEPYYDSGDYFYDWYIKELKLYVELDGGVRPEVITKKIALNRELGVECLYIPYKEIYYSKNKTLYDLIENKDKYIETYCSQP